jgi:hypothetical protein
MKHFSFTALKDTVLQKMEGGELLDLKPNRNNFVEGSNMKKNSFPRIRIICGTTFEFEYLGEFEFIFKNILGYETGSQLRTKI